MEKGMRHWRLLAGVLAATVWLFGCKTVEAPKTVENLAMENHPDAKAAAEKFVGVFIETLDGKHFAEFGRLIPSNSKDKIKQSDYEEMCAGIQKSFGTLVSHHYFGDLQQPLVRDYLWKMNFVRKPVSPQSNIKEISNDLLFRVRVGKLDGNYKVVGFGFIQ